MCKKQRKMFCILYNLMCAMLYYWVLCQNWLYSESDWIMSDWASGVVSKWRTDKFGEELLVPKKYIWNAFFAILSIRLYLVPGVQRDNTVNQRNGSLSHFMGLSTTFCHVAKYLSNNLFVNRKLRLRFFLNKKRINFPQ